MEVKIREMGILADSLHMLHSPIVSTLNQLVE